MANGPVEEADGLQQVEGAGGDALQGRDGLLEGQADGALAGEVVDLVRYGERSGVTGGLTARGRHRSQDRSQSRTEAGVGHRGR